MAISDLACRPDPFVGTGRRHPDVGNHDIRLEGFDSVDELVVGLDGGEQVEARLLEQHRDALSDDEAVLGKHDGNRHAYDDTLAARCASY